MFRNQSGSIAIAIILVTLGLAVAAGGFFSQTPYYAQQRKL